MSKINRTAEGAETQQNVTPSGRGILNRGILHNSTIGKLVGGVMLIGATGAVAVATRNAAAETVACVTEVEGKPRGLVIDRVDPDNNSADKEITPDNPSNSMAGNSPNVVGDRLLLYCNDWQSAAYYSSLDFNLENQQTVDNQLGSINRGLGDRGIGLLSDKVSLFYLNNDTLESRGTGPSGNERVMFGGYMFVRNAKDTGSGQFVDNIDIVSEEDILNGALLNGNSENIIRSWEINNEQSYDKGFSIDQNAQKILVGMGNRYLDIPFDAYFDANTNSITNIDGLIDTIPQNFIETPFTISAIYTDLDGYRFFKSNI